MVHYKYKHRELFNVSKSAKEELSKMRPSDVCSYMSGGEFADDKLVNILLGIDELFTTSGDFFNFDDTFKEVLDMTNGRDGRNMIDYVKRVELLSVMLSDFGLLANAKQLLIVMDYHIKKFDGFPTDDVDFITWTHPIGDNNASEYDAANLIEL